MVSRRQMGPGLLVTAAFIGPGTVTTASTAGANFGFALMWALVFSIFATLVLQEMAARLGLVTGRGLAEAMRSAGDNALISKIAVLLVITAIGFGNAAYEVGNIAGAALAAASVTDISVGTWSLVIGACSGLLLGSGRYKLLEAVLISLVLVMSLTFIATATALSPNLFELLTGMLVPTLPPGSLLTVIGLVGTTVVPYNLFLHANAVREKWPGRDTLESNLRESRWDTGLSVGLGGLISLAIVSTAATAFFKTGLDFSASSMGEQLAPLLGPAAKYVFAAGLFAGGITSAITAPLASAYAVCGAMGWDQKLNSRPFRLVWGIVLLAGTVLAAAGSKPLAAILLAQVANGLLLPVVAIFLLWVMNQRRLLGDYCNGPTANILGGFVVIVAISLGGIKLMGVGGLL
ncbi:MAG: Nramp family divalent metal transporter [Halioglobus sp.]